MKYGIKIMKTKETYVIEKNIIQKSRHDIDYEFNKLDDTFKRIIK
jgi:hypothetical protein